MAHVLCMYAQTQICTYTPISVRNTSRQMSCTHILGISYKCKPSSSKVTPTA